MTKLTPFLSFFSSSPFPPVLSFTLYHCPPKGQGFLATLKCGQAFQAGLVALGVSIIDIIAINFEWYDGLICFVVAGIIMRVLPSTANKLFSSSSLMFYWRFGRAEDNEDPFNLKVPLERVLLKSKISERLYGILSGRR